MKLVSIRSENGLKPGAIIGENVLDFTKAAALFPKCGPVGKSLKHILSLGQAGLDTAKALIDAATGESDVFSDVFSPVKSTPLACPLPDPGIIICAGQTYRSHVLEMSKRRGIKNPEMPETPRGFLKNPNAVIGPGDDIVLPASHPNHVDFEGEFAFVIGKDCHDIAGVDAMDYVAGYTLINDVSARDWAGGKGTRDQTLLGKQFPTFCPLGPVLATKDEIPNPASVVLTTHLNGELMQTGRADDLLFPMEEILSWYSRFYQFRAGDIITTGTPGGTGHGRDPKIFLAPGDRIEISVDGIGTLTNNVKSKF